MNKHTIVTIIVFIVLAAVLGLTYQFYLKEKIEAYDKAEAEYEQLENRLRELKSTFGTEDPQEFVRERKELVAPLRQAETIRAQYFHLRDLWEEAEIPEDQLSLIKFYYGDQYKAKQNELLQEAYTRAPQPFMLPQDPFSTYLGVPNPAQLNNVSVNKDDVKRWLTRINFGSNLLRMLSDANVYALSDFVLWPPRTEFNNLRMHTLGVNMMIRAEDLVKFIEELQTADRYFSINAIRIQNPNLTWPYGSPYLYVEMLLTMAEYVENPGASGAVLASTGSTSGTGMTMPQFNPFAGLQGLPSNSSTRPGTAAAAQPKESWWQKLWPF